MADDDYSFLASLSAHPNRPGDTSKLDPTFADNMAAALREARAAGLNVGIASGYRAPGELTGQGVQGPAARFDAAGNSLHSYGLASDISGLGGANSPAARQWAAIAARHNLYNPYGIGNTAEFNHWQALPFNLDQRPDVRAALQQGGGSAAYAYLDSPSTIANAPAVAAINAAAPLPPPRPTDLGASGGFTRDNPFIAALGNAESNWRNIPSTVDKDPAGPGTKSQGFLQIDTPTWNQFAPKVGVTAPNAMAASEADQIKVASAIPFSRFGPRTQTMLTKQFGNFDKSATVGELAANYGGGGAPATAVASAAPSAPAAAPATAVAAAVPAATPSPYQNFTAAAQQGDVGGMLGALGQKGVDDQGKQTPSTLDTVAQNYAKQQQQNPIQPPPTPVAENNMTYRLPAAQQLMSQVMAESAKPLAWSRAPYGSGQAGAVSPPGTSLISTSNPWSYPYG